ncbi:MAG: sulfatase-like hydrolase/transferase [Evtepia sp.]
MHHIRKQNPWLTLLLLLAVGTAYTALALSLSGLNGVSWGGDPVLFLWNALPVYLMLGLVWLASGWAWLACLVAGALVFLLSAGNYFKLLFRGDPVLWADLHNFREGTKMAGSYDVVFTPVMWAFLVVIFVSALLLFRLGRGRPGPMVRLLALTAVGMFTLVCFYEIYPDNDRYTALAGEHAKNETEAYVSCGVIYPFFHSYGDYAGSTASYDEREARELYNQYQDADIPEEKKVNLVAIQLEAFADFSLYDIQGLDPEVYRQFHELQAQSYSGNLVTDIFAGGTTESEWAVLTGGNRHGDFKTKTDSVAWYLKSQGYTANGAHPCREWFYDRKTVNPNLGLDDYLFTDNYYYQFVGEGEDVAFDDVFFPDLENRLAEYFSASSAPLFSFNVTYQGHGPYNTEKTYWGSSYCTGDYPQDVSNALNNYFHLVQDTSGYVVEFLDFLESLDEPVVLLLYGDHKPWMGNNGAFYETLGINLDTSTEEGFLNYYSTWYTIWANSAAKEVTGCDFVGEGPDLSPCFLMNEVFQLCGWEGSAYMQAQRETARTLPVLHTTGWVKENGVYTPDPSPQAQAMMERFQNLSQYDRTRWQ